MATTMSQLIALMLFCASVACGVIAHHLTRGLGHSLPSIQRHWFRASFSLCLFLGVWTMSSYILWRLRVPLSIGSIIEGKMSAQWWLGPVWLMFAALSYLQINDRR
jgi:hypothetical protein